MDKITLEKYVTVAEQMRKSENYMLDIRKYDALEVSIIATLCQNDNIFHFFNSVKDMDIRKLKAILDLLDAQEKMQRVKEILCD